MNCLLLDGKLYIILFIVGDSGCETETGFSVFKSNRVQEILFLLNLNLYFALVQWFQFFFLILLEKIYPFSFEILTQASNSL